MSHDFRNGFNGVVLVGSYSLDVTEWTADFEVEILDTTNTGDGGWQSNINGCKKASGTVKTFYDAAAIPTGASGANVQNGTSVTLTLTEGDTSKTNVVPARIGKVTLGNPVKGVLPFEFSYESNGVCTMAT